MNDTCQIRKTVILKGYFAHNRTEVEKKLGDQIMGIHKTVKHLKLLLLTGNSFCT